MSDSDESFNNLKDIKPYNLILLVNKVTDSIKQKELAPASADVHLEQPPVSPTPSPGPQ